MIFFGIVQAFSQHDTGLKIEKNAERPASILKWRADLKNTLHFFMLFEIRIVISRQDSCKL